MSYESLIQAELDLSESITLLMRHSNELASVNVLAFSKVLHAELYLRSQHKELVKQFAVSA